MFTGIIEEVGKVLSVAVGARSASLTIEGNRIFEDVKLGDSIAVNGVCLTVNAFAKKGKDGGGSFTADVMSETLRRSTLGQLRPGSSVNLERAMPADGRFGGHIVTGHIDGTGTLTNIREDDNARWLTVSVSKDILRFVVEKGSIGMDGISLTVASVGEDSFAVSIIPHTTKMTTLGQKKVGDLINLENDIIGKYVEKLLADQVVQTKTAQSQTAQTRGQGLPPSGVTEALLAKAGF